MNGNVKDAEYVKQMMYDKITQSGLDGKAFKKTIDGQETGLYVITNGNGMEVTISTYGAKIVSLLVPDKNGKLVDVVLGHQNIEDYLKSEEPYFGAICGRYANRIAKGKFTLNGKEYTLATNNGPNHLHGGIKGLNSVVWKPCEYTTDSLVLEYVSPDGEEGYPGEMTIRLVYSVSEENALRITLEPRSTEDTIVNLTNHSYFNLSGEGDPDVGDHILQIYADNYLPTDETAIPLGDPQSVKGTPMDFTTPHAIGERINDDFEQLHIGKGYDHTYVLNKGDHNFDEIAKIYSPKTGIRMTVKTNQPGVQLYTANWLTGNCVGKHGHRYPMRSAFCLETQHFPDSPNKPQYPSTFLPKGDRPNFDTHFKFDCVE